MPWLSEQLRRLNNVWTTQQPGDAVVRYVPRAISRSGNDCEVKTTRSQYLPLITAEFQTPFSHKLKHPLDDTHTPFLFKV
jgi:hypothetical protein